MSFFELIVNWLFTIFADNTGDYTEFFDVQYVVGGVNINFSSWLCYTLAIIGTIFVIVLCCLFIYKIIKLIGGLIR